MMPWVVLGIMIAIGLLVSVIYTAVVFFIDGFVLTGVLWLVFGLIACGKCHIIIKILLIFLLNSCELEGNIKLNC